MWKTGRISGVLLLVAAILMPAIALGQSLDADSSIESETLPKTEAEKRILRVIDDLAESDIRMARVSWNDGRLLRILTEAVGAKNVVEIGTSHGFSALWFCLALQTTGGKLITHEIDPYRISMARKNFKQAGVEAIVTLVEGDAHKKVKKLKERIDIIFLDADKSGYIDYLNKLLPLVRPGGLILAHNTSGQSESMMDYLKAITSDPNLETIFLFEDNAGIGVTLKKRDLRK